MAHVRKRKPLPQLVTVPFTFTLDMSVLVQPYSWLLPDQLLREAPPAWVTCPHLHQSLSLVGLGYFDWPTWAGEVGPYD